MPKIAIGADDLAALYVGEEEVIAAYVGDEQVYDKVGEPTIAEITVPVTYHGDTGISPYTLTSQALGAEPGEGERRYIFVLWGVSSTSTGSTSFSSGSINGVSATNIAGGDDAGSPASALSGIMWAEVPTGTSGTIAISLSLAAHIGISVIRVIVTGGVLQVSDTGSDVGDDPSDTLAVDAGGAILAAALGSRAGTSVTWTLANELADNSPEQNTIFSSAYQSFVSADPTFVVTANFAGAVTKGSLAAAAIRAAAPT